MGKAAKLAALTAGREILFFNSFYSIFFANRVSQLPEGGAGLGSAARSLSAMLSARCCAMWPQSCPCAAAELQQLKLSLVKLIWVCSRIVGRRMWSEIALLLPPMAKPVGAVLYFRSLIQSRVGESFAVPITLCEPTGISESSTMKEMLPNRDL